MTDKDHTWHQELVRLAVALVCQTDPPVDEWLKFTDLVSQWREERGAKSSITEAASCPAYQTIIGMGSVAVPFLITQLRNEGDEPDQWFWALRSITGVDPVPDDDRGNYLKMSKAWIEWADKQNAW